jgi:hypothetical protein
LFFGSLEAIEAESLDRSPDETFSTDLLFWNCTGNPSPDQLFDGFQHIAVRSKETGWSSLLNLENCRNSEQVKKSFKTFGDGQIRAVMQID